MPLQARQSLPLQCHINLACEEVGELLVRVEHWRHQESVPERLPVLPVVLNIRLVWLDVFHSIAKRPLDGRIGIGTLQKATVSAYNLFAIIAGQAAKSIVGEHDRIVRQARISDDHRHARGMHGSYERVGVIVEARYLACNAFIVRDALTRAIADIHSVRQ